MSHPVIHFKCKLISNMSCSNIHCFTFRCSHQVVSPTKKKTRFMGLDMVFLLHEFAPGTHSRMFFHKQRPAMAHHSSSSNQILPMYLGPTSKGSDFIYRFSNSHTVRPTFSILYRFLCRHFTDKFP